MRILIPDLAQQDHSSSKIAVSYGLILEEYYMQRRKIQIWLGILAICTSLGTPISTYADTQDVTTNVGDKTTIKSDGSDKETTNGQEDSSDTTSGGDTTVHYTEAQLKAMDAKKKLNYELRSILTEVRKNADENGMFHSPNSSIKDIGYSYGTVDVKKDQIDQILDYLKDFESVLNKDNNRQDFDVISSVTNPIFDNMHMPKKSFSEPTIEDGGGKIALMDKNGDLSLIVSASDAPSDGLLATYEKSLQTDQENGNKGQDSESSSNAEDSTDKNTNGQNGSDSNKGDNQNSSYLTGNSADDILLRQVMDAIAKKMGFDACFPVSGQTYSRKVDTRVANILAGIAASAHKFSNDIRLLQHLKEIEEPFEKSQIGSSAMAYKRNPMRSERIASLSRYVITDALNPAITSSVQWFERTLDDSANKRLSIPEGFLAIDGILDLCMNVVDGLVVYPKVILKHMMAELPFMATENIMMDAVKAGGDRQELHERIRELSMIAGKHVKEEGRDNDLLDLIAADEMFHLTKEELEKTMDPSKYTGRASVQVDAFLKNVVNPVLEANKDALGMTAEINV